MSLDHLRDNPQFQQLRGIVQQNPQLLEPIIQNIAQGNPALAALINQNPEQCLQMLGEGQEGGGEMPGMASIQITPEEREAIGRVSTSPPLDLGFLWVEG
jgi:UV excision repair protein RAD23